ncbi:MAG TPA: transketolase [Spirochaeta sp.]|nr:transketolase [Spirochaeta sp.]
MSKGALNPRVVFGDALLEAGQKNDRVLAISTDSSGGSQLTAFKNEFPERHIEYGIMEQGAVGYAAGLATTGWVPFYAAIAPFVTGRPFEMLKDDLGYMETNVKVVGRCSGITYSDLGPTHHSIDDFAMLQTIPGMTILNPGDPVSIRKAILVAADTYGPMYIRIGSPAMPVIYDESMDFEIGKGIELRDGSDVTLIATGTMLAYAVEACEKLETQGASVQLIDMHTIKPLDRDLISKCAAKTGRIVTLEEHYISGGFGSAVAQHCAEHNPVPVKCLGIKDEWVGNGPYEPLLESCGLSVDQIVESIAKFIK